MLIIPFRVKSPIKHFPIVTIGLIAINVVVFALTTDCRHIIPVIRESTAFEYGFSFGISPWRNFFYSAFLHADPLHLIGNMLFLWVFGRAVEDRMRPILYLAVYFGAGISGSVVQAIFNAVVWKSAHPAIGASGCVMGLLGAYWYLYSWSTVCVYYWFGLLHGVWEIAALWMVSLKLLMDVIEGLISALSGVSSGVSNYCHAGAGVAGALICLILQAKRDSEAVSKAKAIQSESRDLSRMPLHALRAMYKADPSNLELLRAMIVPAIRQGQQFVIDDELKRLGPGLIDDDPKLVAWYLVDMHGNPNSYKPGHLLRLATYMERLGDSIQAIAVYRLIIDGRPDDPVVEMALYRMSLYYLNTLKDIETARTFLNEMQRRFPDGDMLSFTEALSRRLA